MGTRYKEGRSVVWKRSSLTAGLRDGPFVPDLELSLCLLLRSWGGSHVGAREPSPAPTFPWEREEETTKKMPRKSAHQPGSPGAFAQPHRPPRMRQVFRRPRKGRPGQFPPPPPPHVGGEIYSPSERGPRRPAGPELLPLGRAPLMWWGSELGFLRQVS